MLIDSSSKILGIALLHHHGWNRCKYLIFYDMKAPVAIWSSSNPNKLYPLVRRRSYQLHCQMCCKNISTVAAIRSLYFKYNMCRGRLLELFPRQSPDKLASLTTKRPAVVNAVYDAILNSPRDSDVHGRTHCIHSYESRRSKLVRGLGLRTACGGVPFTFIIVYKICWYD